MVGYRGKRVVGVNRWWGSRSSGGLRVGGGQGLVGSKGWWGVRGFWGSRGGEGQGEVGVTENQGMVKV